MELTAQILVTSSIHNSQTSYKRYVGNGEVYTAVRNLCSLKALDIHLSIRIEKFQDVTRRTVNLNGTDITALAHVLRHQSDNITDTSTSFKHVATLESHCAGNIPHGIYHISRSEVGTVTAHIGLLIGLITQELFQITGDNLAVISGCLIVEGLAKTSPSAILAKYGHLLRCSLLSVLGKLLHQLNGLDVRLDTGINTFWSVVFTALRMIVA